MNDDDETGFAAQGSQASPIDITGQVPYEGMVDDTDSYYRIDTILDEMYEFTLSGFTEPLDLRVYPDGLDGFWLRSLSISPGETKDFILVGRSSELIIRISNSSGTAGTNFVLNLDHIPSTLYYIETFPNASGSGANTSLEVWDEYGGLWSTDLDTTAQYAYTWNKFVSGKTYYIKVQDETNTGNYYSIIITDAGFGSSSSGSATWDSFEPNDDQLNATTLILNAVQDHSLYPAGDADWFVFTAP